MTRLRRPLRIGLGCLLVWASLGKIGDPPQFAEILLNYRLLPPASVGVVAVTLPWLELLAGLSLALGIMVEGGALLVVLLGLMFMAGNLWAVHKGLDIACGCFSEDPGGSRAGWSKLALDVLMIGAAWIIRGSKR